VYRCQHGILFRHTLIHKNEPHRLTDVELRFAAVRSLVESRQQLRSAATTALRRAKNAVHCSTIRDRSFPAA